MSSFQSATVYILLGLPWIATCFVAKPPDEAQAGDDASHEVALLQVDKELNSHQTAEDPRFVHVRYVPATAEPALSGAPEATANGLQELQTVDGFVLIWCLFIPVFLIMGVLASPNVFDYAMEAIDSPAWRIAGKDAMFHPKSKTDSHDDDVVFDAVGIHHDNNANSDDQKLLCNQNIHKAIHLAKHTMRYGWCSRVRGNILMILSVSSAALLPTLIAQFDPVETNRESNLQIKYFSLTLSITALLCKTIENVFNWRERGANTIMVASRMKDDIEIFMANTAKSNGATLNDDAIKLFLVVEQWLDDLDDELTDSEKNKLIRNKKSKWDVGDELSDGEKRNNYFSRAIRAKKSKWGSPDAQAETHQRGDGQTPVRLG